MNKEIGYIGLGKMGKNMVFQLLKNGWKVMAYNRTADRLIEVENKGATGNLKLVDMVAKLSKPRTVWLMVPYQAVSEVLKELVPLLDAGDLIIEGGNSPYSETILRAGEINKKGIDFLDIGVSGGPKGALNGACMMVGGKKEIYDKLEKVGFFHDTCVPSGFGYVGPAGAGHFTKMVHNGIEYGMMQSIAEGFDLMRHSKEFDLDLEKISEIYSNGSVITSRLMFWMYDGYKKYGKDLKEISGHASSSGEGKWTLEAGGRGNIYMPAIQASVDVRYASQNKPTYQGKVVSTLRGEFGQHLVKRKDEEPEVL